MLEVLSFCRTTMAHTGITIHPHKFGITAPQAGDYHHSCKANINVPQVGKRRFGLYDLAVTYTVHVNTPASCHSALMHVLLVLLLFVLSILLWCG
jgi:hypothetical protein